MSTEGLLRVATFNLWNRSGPWPERRALIRAELERLNLDVLGLQEVLRFTGGEVEEPCQATAIGAGLGYEVAFGVATDLGGGLAFGNALLSRHPVRSTELIPLPTEDHGQRRAALLSFLETPFGELPVCVTHLHWRLHHGARRLEQVRHLVRELFRLAPASAPRLPLVLLGDFNAEPDADEIRFLRGLATVDGESVYFADVWPWAGDGSPGYTFDPRNRFAALAHEPPRRIDYVFVRGPDSRLRGEPRRAWLCFREPAALAGGEPVWPSDHFGVAADLVMSERAPEAP